MANFNDTFTDTAGTALASHTADSAHTWTVHPVSPNSDLVISNANRLRSNGGSGNLSYYYTSWTPATAEYDTTCVFRCVTESDHDSNSAMTFRMLTSDNYYLLYWDRNNAKIELYKKVSGATTSLGSYTFTPTDNTDYTVLVECRDATKTVYLNGTQRIQSADNALTAKGTIGVRHYQGGGTASNTVGIHIDSLTGNDLVAAGGSGLLLARARNRLVLV